MLKLSHTQFQSIEGSLQEQFHGRLLDLVKELRPDAAERATPEALERILQAAISDARDMGFSTEFEIGVFCAALVLQGRAFHTDASHPLYQVVVRTDVEPKLRAAQLLYELERTSADEADSATN